MSLIKLQGVVSLSAPTNAQKDAALYLFGSKGHSIVNVLDKLARAKEVRAPHLSGLLKFMKEAEDDEIIKFATSAPGKKALAAAISFATAKTLATSIKALRLIRVPVKWLDGHSDAAAARIAETKEIRARKNSAGKPEKPIKLDNPHAPESVTVEQTKPNSALSKIYRLPKNGFGYGNKLSPQWKALMTAANSALSGKFKLTWSKAEGCPQISPVEQGYRKIPRAYVGAAVDDNSWFLYAVAPSDKQGAGIDGRGIGDQLTIASIVSFMRDVMATHKSPQYDILTKMIAGATVFSKEVLHTEDTVPELKEIGDAKRKQDAEGEAKNAINTFAKVRAANVPTITRGAQIKLEEQLDSGLSDSGLHNAQFRTKGTYKALDGYLFELQNTKPGQSELASIAIIPPQNSTKLAGKTWRVAGLHLGRASATDQLDIGATFSLPKIRTAIKSLDKTKVAPKHTPSGKSDISLVDEIAEIPARKIAAKSMQAREEYFNALRNVVQNNLPKMEVSATSTGIVVSGKKLYTLRLDNNAWTLQTGVSGKVKKLGTTFDIVDLLGMVDGSILRPKPKGGSKVEPPYFESIVVDRATGDYKSFIKDGNDVGIDVRFKRVGDTFVFSTPVYPDVQKFITQGMTAAGVKLQTFTGKSITFSSADADKFETWVKSQKKRQALTSTKMFPLIAPAGGGMSHR